MAKDKKTKNPPVEAPVMEKNEDTKQVPAENTKVNMPGGPSGMDQHDKVLYASVIQHRKDEMLKNGGESADKYNALTIIEDATIIDIAVTELVIKKNPSALILTANEKNYSAIKLLAADMGVTLPDFKTLPKPTKEQLKAVGLEAVPGQVVLQLEDKNVSNEAKKKKQEEQKIVDDAKSKDYMKDHTKIETDEQLKEALGFQLVNPTISNPIERLITSTQFYRAYLEARAEKADNAEAELAKIHEFSLADLLKDISTMVPPTFVTAGFGKRLCTLAEDAKSVVPAFCGFKNCVYDKKTKKYKYDDTTIAAFVRVLIVWYASSKNAEMSTAIAEKEKNLKVLKKDEKANAKGIETEEKKIAGLKSAIAHFTDMISMVTDPSFDIADNFIVAYNDKENKDYISARAIAKEIINTYYRDVEIPELEMDSLVLNIQQHVGIILNMFNSVDMQRDEYDESNLVVFDAPKKEAATTEEEGKNS